MGLAHSEEDTQHREIHQNRGEEIISFHYQSMMNTAIHCIVFLACITMTICTSPFILQCQCLTTRRTINIALIANVKDLPPRHICKRREVIVVLKDRQSYCLDPEGEFTKKLLLAISRQKEKTANMRSKTTLPTIQQYLATSP
ncbi:hypothetical protein PBY51_002770 [Eleginops maclovinus]|uniref:Chemokine interleukin-8-like domain-containing protein n=1 Tax=Eleginops maclovinus TaxID=56733 RepID=A0AAN7XDB4_ELEMC|nr:hypothetical protein PBY51_002770 [Eleginops maclovinus]